ncbi:proton-coupled amino acid transporter-like protein pathetic isoform X1 [Diorhabda carinulata]|uniref:proton-coupled amino acid transporter-like protein pathetic isoform X1 n=1 Tax=Diorhabda carinulata TaxID=1163345 RepID=UPI0025A26A7B|nr:proton-coupled amino acid transporter-like protein pathetic isoform X1 [Diorhabda carinulata]XP_057669263.1 proton-coupled amino acid transporter-like protein pathetic isoform X1 [Diorhabda carinulata]
MTTEKSNSIPCIEFSSRVNLPNNDQLCTIDVMKKEYEPYANRKLQHPNTYFGAVVHIIKGSLGIGIFSVPRAFKTAGLLVGTIGTLFVGILCTYNVHLLVRASHIICTRTKTPSLGFSETIEAVFQNGPRWIQPWASCAKFFVEIALSLTYYLSAAVYVVLISESLTKLVSFYYPPAADWGLYFKIAAFCVLLCLCQIRELNHLVPLSLIANVTIVTAFGITLYYIALKIQTVDVKDRDLFTNVGSLPTFFSTVLFSIEGIGTIMPVENSMLEPRFVGTVGVLNVAMFCVVTIYTAMGFFGYFAFGEETHAAITQNLPNEEWPAQVVQACISITMILSFTLIFYVPTEIVWKKIELHVKYKKQNIFQVIMRVVTLTLIISIAAAAGSSMNILIDLTGAIFFSILGIFIPAVVDIVINWNDWGTLNWSLWKNLLLCVAFVAAITSGTYSAIRNII